jgi:hypothetical protein
MSDLAARVRDVLDTDPDEYRARAERDAAALKEHLAEGTFDNHRASVGLEYEFYAVAADRRTGDDRPTLSRVPRRLLDLIGFEKELGLHNAEMTTNPQPLNAYGLTAQAAEVRARLTAALDCTRSEGMRLVSDAIWTVPPAGETARGYLTDSVDDGGVRVATNMSDAVRYHAMANGPASPDRTTLRAPHVSLSADTVMPESLITSIQPHYQVTHAADLPLYHNYAVRLAGPLLALGVNSPFFPPDLYDDGIGVETVLADACAEHRIDVFESCLNVDGAEKVRFPDDLDDVAEAVDRIVDDPVIVPMPDEATRGRFDDAFATLRRKHGTFWRWVRPVFDGPTRSAANARIEFRPLPAQPTVRDVVAFQTAYAGLLESLPRREHPVIDLDWTVARDNFYAAAREGLDADLRWITNDGQETTNPSVLYDDLLAHAAAGLRSAGCSAAEAEGYLEPLRHRVETRLTPADWKRARVREAAASGADLEAAIHAMQTDYVAEQSETLVEGSFASWG